jgi:hypothetical protein
MSNVCTGCDRTLRDGYLCKVCTVALADTLAALPHLIGELMITAYRQDRVAVTPGRGSGERPLPFKAKAARLLADVRVHLLSFMVINDARVLIQGDLRVCEALAAGVPHRASADPNVGRMFTVLSNDESRIREAIDLPKSFRYLGRCDHCGAELYADRSAEVWVCPGQDCEASYEVKARMADLIERSRDVVAPTSTIATALTSLEYPVTEELIRKWASRGLLTPRTSVGRTRWYRFGDVLDQLLKQRTREADRSPRKRATAHRP